MDSKCQILILKTTEVNERTLNDDRRIGTNEKCDSTSTTGRACGALSINGDVTADNNGIATIPGSGFYPVNCVEKGSSGAVACILGVDTLDIEVTGVGK